MGVLELLISTAGTGQISALWCRRRVGDQPTGTCLVKKLCMLFSAGPTAAASPSHRVPPSHSGQRAAPPGRAVRQLRGELRPPELQHWTVTTPPALDVSPDSQWVRLVALVMSRQASLPPTACCRSNLTLLVVQLLYRVVNDWEHGSGEASWAATLLPALHRLSDLDTAFSASVSRVRMYYLVAMETLGRRWRQLGLSAQLVAVLQELYKFRRGTFGGGTQASDT
ncbi:uncharacterized protein LOC119099313 [Pollicipes pollicipes]|uniref:uncharacterized protein LOC119099313 n=1 Tax=Pollicipes pollicipes TaxID=41117 RepID=UPI001885232B|nr:uncharacterized protein LOC119099313 [Pollicipes pollicipes]